MSSRKVTQIETLYKNQAPKIQIHTPLPIILENIIITAEVQPRFLPITASSRLTSSSTARFPKAGFKLVVPYSEDEDDEEVGTDGTSC